MDLTSLILGTIFLWSSSVYIVIHASFSSFWLTGAYITFLLIYACGLIKLASVPGMVFDSPLGIVNGFLYLTILLARLGAVTGSGLGQIVDSLQLNNNLAQAPTAFTSSDSGAPIIPNILDPEAVDAQTVCPGYRASAVTQTSLGLTATLLLAGDACNVYGNDVDALNLTVTYQAEDRLSVKIQPAKIDSTNSSWYILPEYVAPSPGIDYSASGNAPLNHDLEFSWSNEPTFFFEVIRARSGDVLFSTKGNKIVYEDQFIEFASTLREDYNLYGLGETIHGLRLGNDFTKTFWAADIGDPIDGNIYGSHPFYVETRYYALEHSTGNWNLLTGSDADPDIEYVSHSHGVYNRNGHGQDVLLRPTNITWRAIGGSIDLYFYSGPGVKEVISSYQKSASGLPAMQQYWTFGYHQCRWGYNNWTHLQSVVENFRASGIPLETIWTDIDYMDRYRDFDNDPIRFSYSEGAKFLDQLHAKDQHYIPIIDSAIYYPDPRNTSDVYLPFSRGNTSNSFMLNPDGSLYVGEVWPGNTVFPDWLPGSGANAWWVNEVSRWHSKVEFSGIWIDMNEVSSFCVGSCGSSFTAQDEVPEIAAGDVVGQQLMRGIITPSKTTSYLRTTPTPGTRNVNYPPYAINNIHGDLAVHAVSPNATHHDGTVEYDVHNLFGTMILNATYNALLNIFPTKRPFIIGRSTFVGSGKHAGHWGGDNASKWYYMFFSIPQALQSSMAGIPMFGVDACGFQSNTTEELCNRWMQLAAFFPFYRNHNHVRSISQEPYVWPSVAEATKTAMAIRFQLMPYLYTLFHDAHTTGSTVMRALAWEFPNDPSLRNADRQFFLGPAILVTPVLEQGATAVRGVFPGTGTGPTKIDTTIYYDWYTQAPVPASNGQNISIPAPLGHIPVYIRGGYILALQQPAYTTAAARRTPWSLLVALDTQDNADGHLYLDDGESLDPGDATLAVTFTATANSLSVSSAGRYVDTNPLANISILGASYSSSSAKAWNVTLNGTPLDGVNVSYNATSQVLSFGGLESLTSSTAEWSGAGNGAWSKREWMLRW